MKRIIAVLLVLALAACMVPAVFALTVTPDMIAGTTWYGEYTGYSGSVDVQRYMNMTIKTCDAAGNITGTGYVTTVPGQGYDDQWINYEFRGKVNLDTGACWMQGYRQLAANSSTNWSFAKFQGTMTDSAVTGICDGDESRTFYYARTSAWAMDEVTEANALGLIPDTLRGKDLTQPITRAEFAAVCATAYEKLKNTEIAPYQGSKFIDIYGNENETYIRKAYAVNIAVGTSDYAFDPDKGLSRQEMATMLTRMIKKYKYDDWTYADDSKYVIDWSVSRKFDDDYLIADWAKQSVYFLYKLGIVKGVSEEPLLFAPYNTSTEEEAILYATATRQQAIAMALRVYKVSDQINISDAGETPSSSEYMTVRVSSGYLALRSAKNYDYTNEIGALNTGDRVQVMDRSDSTYWYVYAPSLGKYGYVNRNYLY